MTFRLKLVTIAGLCLITSGTPAQNVRTYIPVGAKTYAPLLVAKQEATWPTAPEPWTLGGLIEQESCQSLKHRKCWNPHAELKTSREYGFGFGQITITSRFNEFNELKKQHASLRNWQWSNRYDPGYQLQAVVEMTYQLWRHVPPATTSTDHWAFTLSSYNGGLGGLLQDRRYCANSRGCNPKVWFGNVETHSLKSRAPNRAYGGKSWFQINREHSRNILKLRRDKYRVFWTANLQPAPKPAAPTKTCKWPVWLCPS